MADSKNTAAITVVMAVYNGEKYLKEQLDSIAAQTLLPDEILIRIDGSHDGSSRVIETWKAAHPQIRVKLLNGDENLGYIGNFYRLLEHAQGEYIFLSDQDDRWAPAKVQMMTAILKMHPEISLLASSFGFMNENSEKYEVPLREGWSNHNLIPWQIEQPGGLNEITFEQMLAHNYFQGAAMVIRRSLKDQYVKLYDRSLAHDWMLALSASVRGGLYYLDQELFDYRIHQGNVTGLPQAKKRSKLRTLKTWMNRYYRTIVAQDMLRVLDAVKNDFPERFDADCSNRHDYLHKYLSAIDDKALTRYLKLASHPGRALCMSRKEYAVGAAFVLLSKFFRMPEGKV